jgi:hypothetical protein
VVRIHAGEPAFKFNNLQDGCPAFVRILYGLVHAIRHNSLTLLQKRVEHGFEVWNQEYDLARSGGSTYSAREAVKSLADRFPFCDRPLRI